MPRPPSGVDSLIHHRIQLINFIGGIMSNTDTSANAKPVQKYRDGALEVAIWRRDGEKGPFYTVSMSRSYKQGEHWKQSDSYAADDLLPLAKLLDQAHSWIKSNPPKQQAA
jgi:hypothetical protein